ncbi:MAG: ABC transporter ATP-binding protein [Anaerolineae bacterium]|nr:ABC transporter ATP-binding protein [Anaerolineae bacterium]MDK1081206.1 ABC transporter ATP-binding protein [Anaerolineae bacterium]MDK1118347.1 ABC transporter ATP-binding protein [Anaerolineae bacterium]
MTVPAVELVNVIKHFGDVVAVNDVNLKIEDGEFFSLLGPSGCGKTTTLRMIAGLETLTSGEILLRGKAIGQTPAFKRPVNTVFQNYALFPHLTVERNVAFGLEMHKIPKEEIKKRVAEALDMVLMGDLSRRRPNQLSGGQQQRIALARALVNRPEVLLLDEPLGALDLKLRKAMQLELKQLQEQVGITFIYVTHDQEEALTMSDRIAVMDEGKILQIGAPQEIYEHPNTRFVADFIGETNFLEGTVSDINGEAIDVSLDDHTIVKAHSDLSVQKGQKVGVVIRPEKINLASSGMVEGKVLEIIYIGTDTRYVVQLKDNTSITVREQNLNSTQANKYKRGDKVGLNWDPANAQVLKK